MPIHPKEIEVLIKNSLPGSEVVVEDTIGDGDHLQAIVISDLFEGKTLLEQHQMVYSPLKETLKEQLHALALKTYTPGQWRKK